MRTLWASYQYNGALKMESVSHLPKVRILYKFAGFGWLKRVLYCHWSDPLCLSGEVDIVNNLEVVEKVVCLWLAWHGSLWQLPALVPRVTLSLSVYFCEVWFPFSDCVTGAVPLLCSDRRYSVAKRLWLKTWECLWSGLKSAIKRKWSISLHFYFQ